MEREVQLTPEAVEDLQSLYDYIASHSGAWRAEAFTSSVIAYLGGLALFPERGRRRDDLRPGLRVIGFRRRVTIAFHVVDTAVRIDRVLYAGRNIEFAFDGGDEGGEDDD